MEKLSFLNIQYLEQIECLHSQLEKQQKDSKILAARENELKVANEKIQALSDSINKLQQQQAESMEKIQQLQTQNQHLEKV